MLTLAAAVLVASLVGSLHCVGMCGPFALWATHGGTARGTVAAYHVGRLTTYLSAGLAAGVLGSMVEIGGDVAGYQSLAAKIAGGLLIFVGLARLLLLLPVFRRPVGPPQPSKSAAFLQQFRSVIASRGPVTRAYLGGLLTTWLPCGWLYLFVLVATGTGRVSLSLAVMFAFWVGTVPALTALVMGARSLVPKFQTSLPVIAGVLLILTGLYTATGRAAADLSTMVKPRIDADPGLAELIGLADEPLPCCEPVSGE